MAFPGAKLVQRVFGSNFRFSLYSKTIRSVSVVENKALLHNCATKQVSNTVLQVPLNFIQRSQVRAMGSLSPLDPSSYSRPELAVVRHVSLSLNVDFENKVLNGTAVLSFEVLEDINELILDVSNLTIESIQLDDDTALEFTIDGLISNFGSKLTIKLPKQVSATEKKVGTDNVQKNEKEKEICPGFMKKTAMSLTFTGFEYRPVMQDAITETEIKFDVEEVTSLDSHDSCKCVSEAQAPKEKRPSQNNVVIDNPVESLDNDERLKIKIKYSTAPTASALQWLEPSQTSGKKYPYMFSQCQPIHARSIMPCQDTPAVKFTYDAEVSAPEEFTVLMSAIKGETRNAKATFKQPIPIPSYLLALAVGVLESRPLGPRSKVWSEKEEVEKSAWEFAETEKYLQAAERLCGPYQWTQYDLLVLPPSFPYGGMENPCLTFVTPTLLAGDRSQADVIVHEIMHSWTGNLITNVNFEHFWLNEGFTVFLERKVGASLIADPVEAKKSRDFHSLLGLQELSEAVNEQFGPTDPLTRLVPDLHGIHPDDAFSRVPYEKGSLFLRYLEDLVGGPEVFDDFLRSYLNHFQKKSLNTDQFKEYLLNYFKEGGKLADVDWDSWFYKSGMPPVIPAYDTSMTKDITSLLAKIEEPNATLAYEDVKTFTPHQMINLLQELIDRPALPLDQLRAVGEEYKVAQNKNTEILYRWLRLCVRSRDSEKIPDVFDFVNSQGRMKYVRPLYRDLYAWEDVRDQAIDNFLKNEPNMMHVSAYTVRKDLHLN